MVYRYTYIIYSMYKEKNKYQRWYLRGVILGYLIISQFFVDAINNWKISSKVTS
jgi:hypothetical protein